MNSEELELSLRTEFESYLKDVLADLRQEFSQFQEKIETEFDKHKSQLDGIIRDFSDRVPTDKELDDVFKETVFEHLRLARDEGARITATAIAQAEEMEKETAPSAGISELRDAITDISKQESQAAILKTLVNHAAQFTPRGAFFIVKNEHFVGWRIFGEENEGKDQLAREIYFPVASSTILGESVRSLSAVESSYGTYSGDSIYLNKLDFGQPSRMFAVPLIVRGRGVAVLYADYGTHGESVNIEALETMMHVAGLTVELLAGSHPVKSERDSRPTGDYYQNEPVEEQNNFEEETSAQHETVVTAAEGESEAQFEAQPVVEEFSPIEESVEEYQATEIPADEVEVVEHADSNAFAEPESGDNEFETVEFAGVSGEAEPEEELQPEKEYQEFDDRQPAQEFQPANETYGFDDSEESAEAESAELAEADSTEPSYSWSQTAETAAESLPEYDDGKEARSDSGAYQPPTSKDGFSMPSENGYQFEETPQSFEDAGTPESEFQVPETPPYENAETFTPVQEKFGSYENGKSESTHGEPAAAVNQSTAASPVRTRFSDRNVDLPIEVNEDERRLHNDARRFARLLVSEIKLYNEQKVKEGRDASDLYDRLREAIDRSREMYDKRIQPPVAAKFDYFHYELVSSLAEGEENKLGGRYPGANV